MTHFEMKRLVFGLGLILVAGSLFGHGVGSETFVRIPNPRRGQQGSVEHWMSVDQLQRCVSEYEVRVKAWQERQRLYRLKPVQATSTSQTNCYMQLWFVPNPYQVLRCAPDQLFYVLPQPGPLDNVTGASGAPNYVKYVDEGVAISLGCWAQACTIAAGQVLLRENFDGQGCGIQVEQVDFRAQPLTVYNLDVQDDHTYLVTGYNVVTHNSQLGPDLAHTNFTKGCEVAAATGVLATVGAWLAGLGFTSSSGGLCTIGFSTAVSAPVLIAAGTIGVGYMAWQTLNWFGGKHVRKSQEFNVAQLHKVWAGFNQPTLHCGTGSAQLIEGILPSCEVKLPVLPHMNDQLVGAKEIIVTSCPTSQIQPKGSSEPIAVECSARQGVLMHDAGGGDEDISDGIAREEIKSENISDTDIAIGNILKGCKPGRKTKGKTTQYEKPGGWSEAKSDFESLHPSGVRNVSKEKGRSESEKNTESSEKIIGTLPGDKTVIAREKSTDKRATLEIQNKNKKTKIRYG